jgi:hypothetical protein
MSDTGDGGVRHGLPGFGSCPSGQTAVSEWRDRRRFRRVTGRVKVVLWSTRVGSALRAVVPREGLGGAGVEVMPDAVPSAATRPVGGSGPGPAARVRRTTRGRDGRQGAAVNQITCDQCGRTNPPGTRFCGACHHYLWSDGPGTGTGVRATVPEPVATGAHRAPAPEPERASDARPPVVEVVDEEVTFDPVTGGGFDLRVANPSSIVEGYRVEVVAPPPWLVPEDPTIELLPGTDTVVRVGLGARPDTLVVAARLRLGVRVRLRSDERLHSDVDVALTVPPVGGPAQIRTDPAVVRLQDTRHGRFSVHLDNRGCNHPQRYELSGTDDEGVVRFGFAPPVVEVPAGGGATVGVQVDSPAPAPGEQSSRRLTIRAAAGEVGVETVVGLIQRSSAVSVRLRLEPGLLRTVDLPQAELGVVVDNRAGVRDQRLRLGGRDLEKQVTFAFRSPEVVVAAGTQQRVPARLRAPMPGAGEEVTRQFTVTATDGRHESEVSGSWVQSSSHAPISSAVIRLDPEHVRSWDRPDAQVGVLVDNRRGLRPLRVRLSGSDPEGAVRFGFTPPVLQIAPGRAGRAGLVVAAPPPPPGEETVRTLRVRAGDESGAVEATGAFHQGTSPTALSTARVLLEPEQVVTRNARTGRLRVQVDNRQGVAPLRVRLSGTDPENAVRFTFRPGVLDVPPGQVRGSAVRMSAPRPGSGETVAREVTVTADDGTGTVEATGSFVQSTSVLRPILRVVLTLLGALLVAVGAFLPWLVGDGPEVLPTVPNIAGSIGAIGDAEVADVADAGDLVRQLQPLQRVAVLMMAALMAFGLVGPSGRLTRVSALVVTATMVVVAGFFTIFGLGGPDTGTFLVVLGGVVGFVGGLCVKR